MHRSDEIAWKAAKRTLRPLLQVPRHNRKLDRVGDGEKRALILRDNFVFNSTFSLRDTG